MRDVKAEKARTSTRHIELDAKQWRAEWPVNRTAKGRVNNMNRSKSIVLGATRIVLYNSIDTDERRSGRKTCKHVVGKINTHRPHHDRVAVDKSDIELIDTLPRGEVQPDTKSETSWWRRRYRSDRVHIN